jgi:general secretion pathway protein K
MAAAAGAGGRERERGIALITVLWAMLFLSTVSLSLLAATGTESRLSRNLGAQAAARALADGGVWRAVATLVDPLRDRRWQGDGRVYRFELGDGEVRVAIEDEGGKVDLNAASTPLLEALFLAAGAEPEEAQTLAATIEDWRDEDELRRTRGAEADDYRAAGKRYGPPNRRFESPEDLQLVLGVVPALYTRIADLITVYSRQPGIDPLLAPERVLRIIPGLDEGMIATLLESREEGRLSGRVAPPTSPFFTRSTGTIFTIHAEGRTANGAVFARDAIVRMTGDQRVPYIVLRWKRGARSLFPLPESPTARS